MRSAFLLEDINKSLSLQGGYELEGVHADILEYSEEEGKWTRVGKLAKQRYYHAVSTVDFDKFQDYCQ